MNTSKELVEVLLDDTASDAERDDAAIDLGSISDDAAVEVALLTVANDVNTDEMIRASCGESLAQIWIEHNEFNLKNLCLLTGIAFLEALEMFKREDMNNN